MSEMVERVARAIYESSTPEVQRTYVIATGDMVDCPWEYQPMAARGQFTGLNFPNAR